MASNTVKQASLTVSGNGTVKNPNQQFIGKGLLPSS